MSNITPQKSIKAFFSEENVKSKFKELLGQKAQGFITSVLQCATQNSDLAKADATSVYQAAMMAATLDLPINQNLGFAYIIPYSEKDRSTGQYKKVAQFQMGYKGFIQLAQRSGQFQTISATPIYEGELISQNPLTGFEFDFTKRSSNTVIGYAGYFKLLNGFEKTLYMSVEEVKKHGKQYSQTFKKNFGLWQDNFDAMAIKTVTKLLLSKFAPLSIEMQKAVTVDQAIINDAETEDITYIDNTEEEVNKETERVALMIEAATTEADLQNIEPHVPGELLDLFNTKADHLKSK